MASNLQHGAAGIPKLRDSHTDCCMWVNPAISILQSTTSIQASSAAIIYNYTKASASIRLCSTRLPAKDSTVAARPRARSTIIGYGFILFPPAYFPTKTATDQSALSATTAAQWPVVKPHPALLSLCKHTNVTKTAKHRSHPNALFLPHDRTIGACKLHRDERSLFSQGEEKGYTSACSGVHERDLAQSRFDAVCPYSEAVSALYHVDETTRDLKDCHPTPRLVLQGVFQAQARVCEQERHGGLGAARREQIKFSCLHAVLFSPSILTEPHNHRSRT